MANEELLEFYRDRINAVVAESKRQIDMAAKAVHKDFLPLLVEEGIKPSFTEAINSFYASYSPEYNRNFSLRNILDTTVGTDDVRVGFEDAYLTTFRNGGNGLYDLVFKEGWHGGAKSGKGHPHPGTPYWRSGYAFMDWGRRAERAPISPYEDFMIKVRDYYNTEGKRIFEEMLWSVYEQNATISI